MALGDRRRERRPWFVGEVRVPERRQRRVRRRDGGAAPQGADAGFVEDGFFLSDVLLTALAILVLRAFPAGAGIGNDQSRDGAVQAGTVFSREFVEQAPVGRQPLEENGRGEHLLVQCLDGRGLSGPRLRSWHPSRIAEYHRQQP